MRPHKRNKGNDSLERQALHGNARLDRVYHKASHSFDVSAASGEKGGSRPLVPASKARHRRWVIASDEATPESMWRMIRGFTVRVTNRKALLARFAGQSGETGISWRRSLTAKQVRKAEQSPC